MLNRTTWFTLFLVGSASPVAGWQSQIVAQPPNAASRPKTATQPGTTWVDYKDIHESSGLARSRRTEDLFWTHNDSGDESRLFAFDSAGKVHAVVDVKDSQSVDWEDMCSFTWNDRPFLAIADVGDNAFRRKHITIYGLKEPDIKLIPQSAEGKGAKPDKKKVDVDFEIKVKYPEGAVNCEAMAFDPWRKQFLLASKENLQSRLFAVSFDPKERKQECDAEQIGLFPVPVVTGASISDDGRFLALGTYGPTCLLRRDSETPSPTSRWISKNGEDLEWLRAPLRKQGESICFDKGGRKLFMTSEGHPMPLITSDVP